MNTRTVTVRIPTDGTIPPCPVCGAICVTLDGKPAPCDARRASVATAPEDTAILEALEKLRTLLSDWCPEDLSAFGVVRAACEDLLRARAVLRGVR